MTFSPLRSRRGNLGIGAALLLLLCTGGCQYLGALLSRVVDDPPIPAEYVPTREEMLVLIEDSHNPDLIGIIGDRVMSDVVKNLSAHKVNQIIEPRKLFDFRSEHLDQYRQMPILALAHAMGARQVLYADVISFNVSAPIGSETAKGTITAHVKVIDAQTGETRWPQDAGPRIITVETPTVALKNGSLEPLNDYIVDRLSKGIAELFYSHSPLTNRPTEEKE